MYVPKHFAEQRLDVLHDTINRIGFGSLISLAGGDAPGLAASHIPMHVEERTGTLGVLRGHLARANDQWRTAQPGVPFLAVFLGPDGYISPSYYPSKREHGRVVPTWNYIAVHAHGTPEFFDEPKRLHALVSLLTGLHEGARDQPWEVGMRPIPTLRTSSKASSVSSCRSTHQREVEADAKPLAKRSRGRRGRTGRGRRRREQAARGGRAGNASRGSGTLTGCFRPPLSRPAPRISRCRARENN